MITPLIKIAKPQLLSKGEYLFRQGECAGNFYYVEEGLVKAYYGTPDGRQFIKTFVQERGFLASMQTVVSNQPSAFTAICLENTKVRIIARADLLRAVSDDTEFIRILNGLLLTVASKKEQREYELLCLSPKERYLLLCKRETDLLRRLSQEDIARYLGITPVSLSRIRKRCRANIAEEIPARSHLQ